MRVDSVSVYRTGVRIKWEDGSTVYVKYTDAREANVTAVTSSKRIRVPVRR